MNLLIFTCWLGLMTPPAYRDFSQAGAGFQSDASPLVDLGHLQSVRLGVLGPETSALGQEMRTAIQIAFDEAKPILLTIRDGSWKRVEGSEIAGLD